eukprot:5393158-Amphidinium_carterae.1
MNAHPVSAHERRLYKSGEQQAFLLCGPRLRPLLHHTSNAFISVQHVGSGQALEARMASMFRQIESAFAWSILGLRFACLHDCETHELKTSAWHAWRTQAICTSCHFSCQMASQRICPLLDSTSTSGNPTVK